MPERLLPIAVERGFGGSNYELFSINIQSLRSKISLLDGFLIERDSTYLALCISEHWMREADITGLCVSQYSVASFFSRSHHSHGGVAIFIRNDLRFMPLSISKFSIEKDCELAGITLPDLNLVLLCVYRWPLGSFTAFLDILSRVLTTVDHHRHRVILTGDFNVKFGSASSEETRLSDLLAEFGLESDFSEPTRLSHCLDNAFYNFDTPVDCNTIDFLYSDHMGLNIGFELPDCAKSIEKRILRPVTQEGLNVFYGGVPLAIWLKEYLGGENTSRQTNQPV